MKVVIDVSPLKSGHQFRGIGTYTRNLIAALKKIDKKNEYELVDSPQKAKAADIVHYPFFDLFFLTLPLVKRKKTVVTIHDLTPLVFPRHYPPGIKGNVRFFVQKISLRGAKAIITDSQNSKKDIVRFLKIPEKKVNVAYLAASPAFRQINLSASQSKKLKTKYKLPSKFVLYVGDVNYNKNVLALVGACKKIKIPVVIVGKQATQIDFDRTHPENQPLVQLIKQYGNDPQVIRTGFIPEEDLIGLYNLADVYCQPSLYEGFGLSILEAMACGCPVVASKISSLPEICGQAAIFVTPADRVNISRGISQVLENRNLRLELVQKGFQQAKKFSWQKTSLATIKIYEKVFNQ